MGRWEGMTRGSHSTGAPPHALPFSERQGCLLVSCATARRPGRQVECQPKPTAVSTQKKPQPPAARPRLRHALHPPPRKTLQPPQRTCASAAMPPLGMVWSWRAAASWRSSSRAASFSARLATLSTSCSAGKCCEGGWRGEGGAGRSAGSCEGVPQLETPTSGAAPARPPPPGAAAAAARRPRVLPRTSFPALTCRLPGTRGSPSCRTRSATASASPAPA